MEQFRGQHSTAQHRLKSSLVLGYIIFLHLLIGVLIFKTNFIPKVRDKLFPSAPFTNTHGSEMIKYHLAMDGSVPNGAAIFLGDSITQGLATAAIAPFSVNYGIGWATCPEILRNIPTYKSLNRASVIFLLVGTNDIGRKWGAKLPSCYSNLINSLPPDTPLIWSGIMPVYSQNARNTEIQKANLTIASLCSRRQNCIYVDTSALCSPDSGGATLFNDGLHPNRTGYQRWIKALKKAYFSASRNQSNNSFKPTPLRGAA